MDKIDETRTVTLGQVRAAFEALLEVVVRECDTMTARAVHYAEVDVMAILAGEWTSAAEPQYVAVDATGEPVF